MQLNPSCISCNSKGCFINQFVSNEWKQKLTVNKTFHHFKSGNVIFREKDPVFGIYFIYSGKVKVFNTGPDGRSQIVRLAGSGDILGHRGFGKEMQYPISATAIDDSIICFIRTIDFIDALESNPTFAIKLLLFYAGELRHAEYKMRSLSQMSVKQKLADAILTVAEIYGTKKLKGKCALVTRLSRQEYADIIGSSIEEVIRTFSFFKKAGIVGLEKKEILLLKEKELDKLLYGFRDVPLP